MAVNRHSREGGTLLFRPSLEPPEFTESENQTIAEPGRQVFVTVNNKVCVNMGYQGQSERGAISLRRFAGAALLPILLNACAVQPPALPVAPALPADPILQAVATARLPQTVTIPSGAAIVTVTSDYISAEGNECRGYTLATAGGPPTPHLACNDGAAWRHIPPLAPADNESGLP
jgi:hypothetical protein